MATLDDVATFAASLPEVTEVERRGSRTWCVAGKPFAWERPFTKADVRRFGDADPPAGTILAVRVDGLDEKEAVLAEHAGPVFTIPHFDGFAAVLVTLDTVPDVLLHQVVTDGWLACAPPKLAARLAGT
jgi:hypothetical protein